MVLQLFRRKIPPAQKPSYLFVSVMQKPRPNPGPAVWTDEVDGPIALHDVDEYAVAGDFQAWCGNSPTGSSGSS